MLSDEVAEHRDWLLSLVPAPKVGLWVDLGCGEGVDLMHLAQREPQPGLRMLGLDGNREAIERGPEDELEL